MSHHRGERPRIRYGRVAALGASVLTCLVALLGGVGVLPSAADDVVRAVDPEPPVGTADGAAADLAAGPATDLAAQVADEPADEVPAPTRAQEIAAHPIPARSGKGRRAIFDQSEQRVWIVTAGERALRTYLASGSIKDNLHPGTYEVFSRSEEALGVDGSQMRLFVRFTADEGYAIGFHTIPTDPTRNDRPVQTLDQLGTRLSHGCIRQRTRDARAMWRFAQLGTKVVVID